MGNVVVRGFSVSLDGFGAGPEQSLENPIGVGGMPLHRWLVGTETFKKTVLGASGGSTGVDDDFARRAMDGVGAWILGRNMFAPTRGPWDDSWKGWWGSNPPYHVPVFVLTHHARAPLEMEGGTTFHFVTDGFEEALRRAREAAGDRDVRIGGGVDVVRQALRAGHVDAMHLAFAPVLLGKGEQLLARIDLPALGFRVTQHVATDAALHVVMEKNR